MWATSLLSLASFILPVSLQRPSSIQGLLADPAKHGFEHLSPTIESQISSLSLQHSHANGCQSACALLSILLPSQVSTYGTEDYQPLPYWSAQQAAITPACRLDAESAQSIATAIKVSWLTHCPFTVRSGGHAAFANSSSIQDGILINLAPLKHVSLSTDRKSAHVGAGNNWHNVYTHLDPHNVSVVGGREAGVGVGGMILGGGISYFSGKKGWACDNVLSYEAVLADGKLVNASETSHADLYWALRGGGGSNFGIVTSFELETIELGEGRFWGGSRYYSMEVAPALVTAFARFTAESARDPDAGLFVAFVYAPQAGGYIAISGPTHASPDVRSASDAPIFAELDSIPSFVDTTRVSNMTDFSVELNQTDFLRQTFRTVTVRTDEALLKGIVRLFKEEVDALLAHEVEGLMPAFAMQPLGTNILAKMASRGGNALGLSEKDGPLTILNLNWGWANEKDDEVVHAATKRFLDRSVELAKSMGKDRPFVYMNYAGKDQEVYAGYGQESVHRLREVKEKYDPADVFGRLWKGYFKL